MAFEDRISRESMGETAAMWDSFREVGLQQRLSRLASRRLALPLSGTVSLAHARRCPVRSQRPLGATKQSHTVVAGAFRLSLNGVPWQPLAADGCRFMGGSGAATGSTY